MSRRLLYPVGVALLALLLGTAAQAAQDITGPGDIVQGYPNDGASTVNTRGWPPNEIPTNIIDDQILTKFLHFRGEVEPTGVRITPKVGPTVVTAMTFTTANDAVERDPVKWELYGSNDSIDGPYTLIAKGDIKDFAGATAWPRRTKTTTPIKFANTVAYTHYQVMFPAVRTPASADSMQIAEIELLKDVFVATAPSPANGATGVEMPLLTWVPGDAAAFVDVYVSTSPEIVAGDLFKRYPAATKMAYYAGKYPWAAGQKYYWRVDCIDKSNNVYTGDLWSFTAKPVTAYTPSPMDGDKWISTSTTLSWTPGQGALKHKLYFSTDKNAVVSRDPSVLQGGGEMQAPTFNPGDLAENTAYYWAVDETPATSANVGLLWSFTTIGPGGGIKGEYFNNTTFSGLPALTQIDPGVNFNWAGNGPGAPIGGTGWSARWTADLDIAIADSYIFAITSAGGTRLWIDGNLLIDRWVSWVPTTYASLPAPLTRGIHSLLLEYANWDRTDAQQILMWERPGVAQIVIPAGPLQPPVRARALYPANGDVNVPQEVVLAWSVGEKAAQHNVYFGDDEAAVAAADTSSSLFKGQQEKNTFDAGKLEWNKSYFWRVDEVNDAETDSPWASSVWSFTTADFLVVDNMETYNDEEGTGTRIYETWVDGYTDSLSGSTVGNMDPPFAERTIIHGGAQSMPMDYNNINTPYFSHVYREFSPVQDWTVNGVSDLVLWFRGYPATLPAVTADAAGKMVVKGEGSDIWNNSDQFTFVYKTLNGDGTLVARVTSNGTGTNQWAKGGVMIRDGLDAGSVQAMMVMTAGGGNGASFQYRVAADAASANGDATTVVTLPYYVKIERKVDTLTGSISPDGTTWTPLGTPQYITMTSPAYIGLCVTAGSAGNYRTFEFDKVTATGASGSWQTREIGLTRNGTAPLYVTLEESPTKKATVVNPDPAAINATQWTEWKIPLTQFTGVNVKKVKRLYIGVGDEANPAADGAGRIFIDDIRVMKPVAP